MIGEYIRPLPLPGDKPESLSVKPTFLSRSGGPRCRFESDVSPALWRQLARCTVKQAVDVGSPPSYSFFRVSLLFLLWRKSLNSNTVWLKVQLPPQLIKHWVEKK